MNANERKGILYLLPAPLRPYSADGWTAPAFASELPARALALLRELDSFIVESERTALRFLSRIKTPEEMATLRLFVLDEHTKAESIPELAAGLLEGSDTGLLTEAGLPCVADPGAAVVAYAHEQGIRVVPVPGPSSIMLALMASGLDAQRFAFAGYLPAGKDERRARLAGLGREALYDGMTRIFIETPYRNEAVLEDCVRILPPELHLAFAVELCGPGERVSCLPVSEWKKRPLPELGKTPAVFLFGRKASLEPSARPHPPADRRNRSVRGVKRDARG